MFAKMMRLISIVLNILSTPLFLLCFSSVDALSLWQMCLRVSGIRGFTQSRWDALLGCWEAVRRHGPCGPISSLDPWDRWVL